MNEDQLQRMTEEQETPTQGAPDTITAKFNVGIRTGITMKLGQAAWHRQSNDVGKAVCGKQLKPESIRPVKPLDWYRRCSKCFDGNLGQYTRAYFGLPPVKAINHD